MNRAHGRVARLAAVLLLVSGLTACTHGTTAGAPGTGATTSSPTVDGTPTPTPSPTETTAVGVQATPTPTGAAPTPTPTSPGVASPTARPTGPAVPVKKVTVTVSYSGWMADAAQVEVGAYVEGVIEKTGTCTLTLTRSGRSVTATNPGAADATSTTCGALAIPGTKLSSGTWSAVVSYASPTSAGASTPTEVKVP